MKLVNNRYRVEGLIGSVLNEQGYIVEDLWNPGSNEFMSILDNDKQSKTISYLIDNFLELSQIRHKNLLSTDHFGIIETINLKRTDMLIYYTVSELSTAPKLDMIKDQLSLEDTLELILDIMSVISYLNFRGVIYRFLTPSQIFYSKEVGTKLLSLSSMIEMEQTLYFDRSYEDFIAPEVKMNLNNISHRADYHSVGMVLKYLLFDNYSLEPYNINFKKEFNLSTDKKKYFINLIDNLTSREVFDSSLKLKDEIQKIINLFDFKYEYNYVEERTAIFLRTKIVGRDKEISEFNNICSKIDNRTNELFGAVINGNNGSGKTRLLNEFTYRLKMGGNNVHKLEVIEDDLMEIKNISNFLKLITTNAPLDIINRYKEDFSVLIPEMSLNSNSKDLDLTQVNQRYRIFNRISNFITDLTHDKVLYISIDNFEKANELFVLLMDYLLNICKPNRVFFIFACDNRVVDSDKLVTKLQQWEENKCVLNINLNNLGEEDTEILVQSILGISYLPKKFATIVHRESKGNPGYIDFIIKDLLNREELYINENGNWATKEDNYSDIDFPSNFCDTIKTQINKLDKDQLQVIKAMSIFNTILSKRTLKSLVDLDSDILDFVLSDLLNERIIEEQIVEWGFNYSIINDELKRFVYMDICEPEKLALHESASNAITEFYSDRIKFVFDELIYHLIKSNKVEEALEIILDEAEKIENKYSSYSIVLWEKAYSIIKDKDYLEEKLRILNNLSEIFLLKGDIIKTQIYLKELNRLALEAERFDYVVKAKYYQADMYLKQNQNDELNQEILELEKLSRNKDLNEGIIFSAITRGRMYLNSNNIDQIEEIMNEAIEISNDNSIYDHLGSIYTILGYAEYLKGNTELAIEKYTRSIDYFEASGNVFEVVKPINNLGVIYSELQGDFKKGLDCYEQGLEVATKYGFGYMEAIFLNNIGEIYINSLDYNKALEYITQSLKVAQETNDYRGIFLSQVNLGFIYLFTNQLDRAYNTYVILEKANELNPIVDDEISCQYNNFLGEFNLIFGNLELSYKYSKLASDLSKDFNIKEHLRAEFRMLVIDYKTSGILNKEKAFASINKYKDTGIILENLKNIITLSKMCILNNDDKDALEFYDKFIYLKGNNIADCLEYTSRIVKMVIDKAEINEIENLLSNLGPCELLRADTDLHNYLGLRYMEMKQYPKALRQFLDALDYLYKTTKSIPSGELKFNLIKSKKGDVIKEKVEYIYNSVYGKSINTTYLQEYGEKVDYNQYFNFSPLLEILSKDEFNQIVDTRDNTTKIKNIEQLLSCVTDNYQSNLDLILDYICNETLAQKGYIINIDETNNNFEVLSSFIENDSNLENERSLFQFLRNKGPILINKNSKDLASSKYEEYLSDDLTGIICVPINMNESCTGPFVDRRKFETSINNNFNGYIYLETNKVFNRFDVERFKSICSITNLVYLNIENNSLKLISTTDKLTGTLTRKHFDTRLEDIFDNNKNALVSMSLLMIDIDDFKKVNDSYGHPKGDEVLSKIGQTIRNSIRTSDIVGRYGGEEFIVLLKNTSIENGLELGEKIRVNIEALKIPGIKDVITVSLGMAQFPESSQFKEELINRADQALYNSKQSPFKNKLTLWHEGMEKAEKITDKITGIINGNAIVDNRNILATISTAELIGADKDLIDKAYDLLGWLIEIVESEYASLILLNNNEYQKHLSRIRKSKDWADTITVNRDLIKRVIENKKGEYVIDWHNTESIDKITGSPNWQSVLLVPLINFDKVVGVIYISAPLKEKEFDSQDYNITSLLCNIFAGNIN